MLKYTQRVACLNSFKIDRSGSEAFVTSMTKNWIRSYPLLRIATALLLIPTPTKAQQRLRRAEGGSLQYPQYDPDLRFPATTSSLPRDICLVDENPFGRQVETYHTIIIGAGAADKPAAYTLMNRGNVPSQQMRIVEASQ